MTISFRFHLQINSKSSDPSWLKYLEQFHKKHGKSFKNRPGDLELAAELFWRGVEKVAEPTSSSPEVVKRTLRSSNPVSALKITRVRSLSEAQINAQIPASFPEVKMKSEVKIEVEKLSMSAETVVMSDSDNRDEDF